MTEQGAGSGVKILQDDQRLLVVDTRTASLATVAFVLGLATLIPGALGVVLLVHSVVVLGLVALGVAGVAAAGLGLTIRALLRRRHTPADQLVPLVVIDLAAQTLCDDGGRVLSSLDRVRFRRAFQLGSSSPALVVEYDGQKLVLARGNPFAGGLGTLEEALRRHGLMG